LRVAAMLAIGLAQSARADTIYTYTGNPFASINNPGFRCSTPSCGLTGFFTLPSPLGADFGPSTISPTNYSFADGVFLLGTVIAPSLNPTNSTIVKFLVETNASGDIATAWDIELVANPTPNAGITTIAGLVPLSLDRDSSQVCGGPIFCTGYFAVVTDNPGTWAVTTTASASGPPPTPEPTTLQLPGPGLLGIVGAARRKWLG
jgi:hypothetical protein